MNTKIDSQTVHGILDPKKSERERREALQSVAAELEAKPSQAFELLWLAARLKKLQAVTSSPELRVAVELLLARQVGQPHTLACALQQLASWQLAQLSVRDLRAMRTEQRSNGLRMYDEDRTGSQAFLNQSPLPPCRPT
jgi:hypothetical protein